jgi:hypothetical protein
MEVRVAYERRAVIENCRVGNGGWLHFVRRGLAAQVFARFEERGGRLVMADLVLVAADGDHVISSDLLRQVPVGPIEALANGKVRDALTSSLNFPAPDIRQAVAAYATNLNPSKPPRTWVEEMLLAGYSEEVVPSARVRRPRKLPAFPMLDKSVEIEVEVIDATLEVPKARPYGDDFYGTVAAVYERLAGDGVAPAPAFADANGVPLSTAHRWVKEARRRGFLAPARQGRAG